MKCAFLAVLVLAVPTMATAQRPQPDERQPPGRDQPNVQAVTHEGTVIRLEGNKLALRIQAAKDRAAEETVFTLTPNARVARDGRVLAASALEPGMHVRITTTGAEDLVNRVEVLPAKR